MKGAGDPRAHSSVAGAEWSSSFVLEDARGEPAACRVGDQEAPAWRGARRRRGDQVVNAEITVGRERHGGLMTEP